MQPAAGRRGAGRRERHGDDEAASFLGSHLCEQLLDRGVEVDIGNPDELSMLRLAEWIVELTGSSSPIGFIDLPVDDPKVRRPDTTRAEQLLGWRPQVGSEEGLRRTADWFAAYAASRREAQAG